MVDVMSRIFYHNKKNFCAVSWRGEEKSQAINSGILPPAAWYSAHQNQTKLIILRNNPFQGRNHPVSSKTPTATSPPFLKHSYRKQLTKMSWAQNTDMKGYDESVGMEDLNILNP